VVRRAILALRVARGIGWRLRKHHSMSLQKIRGIGPLVPGLMGMDMCVGCCHMEGHQRLRAEQVANHPCVLSVRKWSAAMEMISDIAPLLRHMEMHMHSRVR
jgi:hypothetical protein